MPDITSISAAVQGIKAATDIAKSLRNVDASLEKAEMKLKIADLTNALADAKISLSEVQELISEKDSKIKELKAKLELDSNLEYEDECYFIKKDKGEDEGPFCYRCYDADGKLVHLVNVKSYRGCYYCKVCENHFGDPNDEPPGANMRM
ncbi:hypothetical protein [Fodinibius sediminis]|uniref:Uncharacterized protein n=1 Tax=Fodinibius sediminis TaxID=1214077 RepID=A0A521FJ31_9BACT|nr:hypothetical protein [Fodinibius sediminis]SMO96024.1 hypothetical protein SAMN06265218_1413 [Fodinibius sediminis]